MVAQRLIVAIGRIERALSRLERLSVAPPAAAPAASNDELSVRHEKLKAETRAAITGINQILAGGV